MLIECHAHICPDAVLARFPNGSSGRFVTAERTVLGRMLAAQEGVGITHALLSDAFYLEHAAEELPHWSTTDRARLFNDELAELIERKQGRFFGLGALDPWGGESAARELERIQRELGFVGALVNPTDGRRFLDDPAAEPVLEAAERLGLPLFIHPTRDLTDGEQYAEFQLALMIGRPAQTTVCAARLIFSGTLDRHPDLRLVLAHAGGLLPYVAGRLDATWAAVRRDPAWGALRWRGPNTLDQAPGRYLRRFYCDTNTWSTPALRLLVDSVGVDRVVVGNDQPPVWFPLEAAMAALDCLELAPDDAEAIRWGNAERLFGLGLSDPL